MKRLSSEPSGGDFLSKRGVFKAKNYVLYLSAPTEDTIFANMLVSVTHESIIFMNIHIPVVPEGMIFMNIVVSGGEDGLFSLQKSRNVVRTGVFLF